MARWAWLTMAALASSGCDLFTALGGGRNLPCDNDQACPPGNLCIEQRCQPVTTCNAIDECSAGLRCDLAGHVCVAGADAAIQDAASADAATDASADHRQPDSAGQDAVAPDHGSATDGGSAADQATPDTSAPDAVPIDRWAADGSVVDAGGIDGSASDLGANDVPVLSNCGNGLVNDPEACDDANHRNGDGCSDACAIEPFYACNGQPSVCHCVYYVHSSLGRGDDGSSWSLAMHGVQAAVDAAASSSFECQVWVAAGTYYVRQSSPTDTLRLRNSTQLFGGFAGAEQTIADRDLRSQRTIIDGTDGTGSDGVAHVLQAILVRGVEVDGLIIGNGNSPNDGGGLYVKDSTVSVRNCEFGLNIAFARGGAIYAQKSATDTHVAVADTMFASNIAGYGGAVGLADGATGELLRCRFADNVAQTSGGALSVEAQAQASVVSALFYDNRAGNGSMSAISATDSTVDVVNSTFTANWSGALGAAIGCFGAQVSCTITNSILWGDSPAEIASLSQSLVVTFSDVEGGVEGLGNIDVDPKFVSPVGGNLALASESPCVDMANDAAAPATDINGVSRFDCPGVGNSGTAADMGAHENNPT